MREPFLLIRNNHYDSCGVPPAMSNDEPGKYYGYFENKYCEQWVFIYDRASRRGELRGGDAGWGRVFEVIDGRPVDLILSQDEAQWLAACWEAVTYWRSRLPPEDEVTHD